MRPDTATLDRVLTGAGASDAEVLDGDLLTIVRVAPERLTSVLQAFKDSDFETLVDIFGSDPGEGIELTYHLRSLSRDEDVYLRIAVPYDGTTSSVWLLYPSALYPEREAAELFGVSFAGHPNPRRLLTCDRVDSFLLRKETPVRTHEEVLRDA